MKTLLRTLLFATAALMATTAQAGNGDLFLTPDECLANLNTAQPYQPTLVSSRARLSEPMNGWDPIGGKGRICASEKTGIESFRGASRAPGTPGKRFFWVVIDKAYVVRNSSGQLADWRCFNPIAEIVWPQQETANVERPVVQTRPRGGTIVIYQQGQVHQTYQPVPIYLPQQSISIPYLGGNNVAVAFGSTNTNNYYQGQQPTMPRFDGTTSPPAVQPPFGGATNPPNTNTPSPVPPPFFNGSTGDGNGVRPPVANVGSFVPYPMGGSIVNGVPSPTGGGYNVVGGVQAPTPGGYTYNNGVQPPNYNGGNIIYNNGVQAPVFNSANNGVQPPNFNGGGNNGNNSFGGFTSAQVQGPVFNGGNNGNNNGFGGSTGNGGGTFTPIPPPSNGPLN